MKLPNLEYVKRLFRELKRMAGLTRPYIAFSVNKIARRLHDGTKEFFRAAKRTLANLVRTQDLALRIKPWDKRPMKLELLTDASFADIPDEKGVVVGMSSSLNNRSFFGNPSI